MLEKLENTENKKKYRLQKSLPTSEINLPAMCFITLYVKGLVKQNYKIFIRKFSLLTSKQVLEVRIK